MTKTVTGAALDALKQKNAKRNAILHTRQRIGQPDLAAAMAPANRIGNPFAGMPLPSTGTPRPTDQPGQLGGTAAELASAAKHQRLAVEKHLTDATNESIATAKLLAQHGHVLQTVGQHLEAQSQDESAAMGMLGMLS